METTTDTVEVESVIDDGDATEDTTPEPLTLEGELLKVDDGSRFADGVERDEIVSTISTMAISFAKRVLGMEKVTKSVAKGLCDLLPSFVWPDGSIDWAMESKTFQAVARVAYDSAFGDLDEDVAKNAKGAVQKQVQRTFRELAIRSHVANLKTLTGDYLFPGKTESERMDNGGEAFRLEVRRQYRLTTEHGRGVKTPTAYQTPEDKQNASSSGSGPTGAKSALDAAWKGVEGLKKVTRVYAAKVLLKGTSALVLQIVSSEGCPPDQRSETEELLARISDVSAVGSAFLRDDATAETVEDNAASFWSESDASDDA